MNVLSITLRIIAGCVVSSILIVGVIEDNFFREFFFIDEPRSTSLGYLVGHLILLLNFLVSLLVVILQALDALPAMRIYWKKLSHRTRTWLIFGGAVTVLIIFRLLLLRIFG
ncbi:MAG: hypothetical protein NUW00_03870 [Candidatus Kaiserbacteria bacterium]|nr:hypothetical protein [Candidatus Kaiserbacteria bacterium]